MILDSEVIVGLENIERAANSLKGKIRSGKCNRSDSYLVERISKIVNDLIRSNKMKETEMAFSSFKRNDA